MELWDPDYLDLETAAYVRFERDGSGEFQFGAVSGTMDCRSDEEDGLPSVAFSWDGNNDNDPCSGRGWAVVDGQAMRGRFFLHFGDDSAFSAVRQVAGANSQRRRA